jgi:hypothetical protein
MKSMNANLTYQIRVRGLIPTAWSDAFTDLDPVQVDDGIGPITVLHGDFEDSAALQGVLNNLCMLGLVLISVDCQNCCHPISDEECHHVDQ